MTDSDLPALTPERCLRLADFLSVHEVSYDHGHERSMFSEAVKALRALSPRVPTTEGVALERFTPCAHALDEEWTKMRPDAEGAWTPVAQADAALAAMQARLDQALDGLRFYADEKNWIDTPSWDGDPDCITPNGIPMQSQGQDDPPICDCGDTARQVLAKIEP